MQLHRTVVALSLAGACALAVSACSSEVGTAAPPVTTISTDVATPSAAATPEDTPEVEAPTSDVSAESPATSSAAPETTTPEETEAPESSTAPESAEPAESAAGDPTEAGVGGAGPAGGDGPSWTIPVTTPGTKIASISTDSVMVDVYQVGIAPAIKDGAFVDPDTKTSLITEGDDLVFVNYVVTNISDETIPLGSSLVRVESRYQDWEWMQGMDGIVDRDAYEGFGLHTGGVTPGEALDPPVYPFAPGEVFSYAENFKYQKDSPIDFSIRMTPVDEAGDLLHDLRQESEGSGVIA